MKSWLAHALGLLLLSACSLNAAPREGADPEAPSYPPWRPSKLSSPDAAAPDRETDDRAAAGSDAVRTSGSAAAGSGGAPSQAPEASATPPAAGSGGRASVEPSAPAAGSGGEAEQPSAAGVTASAPAAGSGGTEASVAGAGGEAASANPPAGEPPSAEAGSGASEPMTPPPSEPTHPPSVDVPNGRPATAAQPSLIGGLLDLLYGVLSIPFGNSELPAVAELLVSIIALSATPDAALTPDTLTHVLDQLDSTLACKKNPADCESACSLLSADCRACEEDGDCLDAIARVCGKAAIRACQPDRGGQGRGRDR